VWKWSWTILRYYSGIFLEDLRKSTKNLSRDIVSFCHDQCIVMDQLALKESLGLVYTHSVSQINSHFEYVCLESL
jgi:hypothetical protein